MNRIRFPSIILATFIVLMVAIVSNLFFRAPINESRDDGVFNEELAANPTAIASPSIGQEEVYIVAMCRGGRGLVIHDDCKQQFNTDRMRVNPGEAVAIVLSKTGPDAEFEFSFDGTGVAVSWDQVAKAISEFELGSTHTIQVRELDGTWSSTFSFGVDLLIPLRPTVDSVCANERCSPEVSLVRPVNPIADQLFPLVEHISGAAQTGQIFGWFEQEYLWAELMLNGNAISLGCLNCALAESHGFLYPDRVEFADTGYFYNWDLKSLRLGDNILQARLRNILYAGEWSDPFIFQVEMD